MENNISKQTDKRIYEQKDLFVSKIKIVSPNPTGTGSTTSEYHVTSHDLSHHFSMTDTTNNGVKYEYDGDNDIWRLTGKATAESTLVLTSGSFPSYLLSGNSYLLSLDDNSTIGVAIIKLVIKYKKTSTSSTEYTQIINYPADVDYPNSYSSDPKPRKIILPDICTSISVSLNVSEGTYLGTKEDPSFVAYHIVPLDLLEVADFVYGQSIQLTIDGGNGYKKTGARSLVYSTEPVDGACSVSSSGNVTFVKPGKSWITIYNKGSNFTKTDIDEDGNTVSLSCTYQQSNLLVLEIEWIERQVIIKVMKDIVIQIGSRIPNIYSDKYQDEDNGYWAKFNVLPVDSLKQNPELFFVYESDDFYKFDVFTQTYSDDRYDNGIRYIKNDDGSWTVSGQATALSYYNLIVSNTMLPDYFKPGRTFKLTIKEKEGDYYKTITNSPLRVYIGWYTADGDYVEDICDRTKIIEVPRQVQSGELIKGKAVGVVMKLRVENGTNLGSGRTFLFNMRYVDDRSMNNLHEGKYPVGARYAQAPNKAGYDQKIQYRSNKGQLKGLWVQNNKKYND